MDSSSDRFRALVAMSFEKLDAPLRAMLLPLLTLPPDPNTFSEDAAIAIGAGSIEKIQKLSESGLLRNLFSTRYSVSKEVCDVLRKYEAPPESERRIAEYYARYADVFQAQTTAIQGEYDNILRGLEAARRAGMRHEFLSIVVALSRALDLRGDYERWRESLKQAVHNPPENADRGLEAIASMHLARLELKAGNLADAEALARKALSSNPEGAVRADALITLGHVLLDQSRLEEARAAVQEGLEVAKEVAAAGAVRQAAVILGTVLTRLGQYEDAAAVTVPAMQEATEAGDLSVFASLATNLGVIYFHQGRFAEAVEVDDRGLAVARQIGFREKEAALLQAKGGALIELGRAEEALGILEEALQIARSIQHRWYIATILKEGGEAHLALGHSFESIQAFEGARQTAPAEAAELHAYAHWGLARSYEAMGVHKQAILEGEESLSTFEQIHHHLAPKVREWLASLDPASTDRERRAASRAEAPPSDTRASES